MPLLGVTVSRHKFAMVSPWMENGNIVDFIVMDPNANRIKLVCAHLDLIDLWLI